MGTSKMQVGHVHSQLNREHVVQNGILSSQNTTVHSVLELFSILVHLVRSEYSRIKNVHNKW